MAGAAPQVQYRQEMVLGFQQRQSLLRDTCTTEGVIKGNQCTFLVADSTGTATTRGVNGLISAADNDNTQKTATLAEKHDLRRMTGWNIFQSQSNQRQIMQMNSMAVINRDIDSVVLTTLATGTITTGTAATASMNMLGKAMVYMQNNGVPWDGNIFAVISPAFLLYLMSLQQFSNADFVNVKPAVNFPGWDAGSPLNQRAGQGFYDWMGVKWVVSNQVSGVGTSSELCFMYHRSAIGHGVDTGGISTAIGYDDEQDYSYARCTLFHGGILLQNSGVVQMTHDGSAIVAS